VTGIVLAGGLSTRLGTAKALLRLGDKTFLELAVSAVRPFCRRIIVVAAAAGCSLPDLEDCTVVADETPGLGPLGGLVTGLAVSDDEWHLTLACDLPLVRPKLLELIVREASGVDAVVPRSGGRLQPRLAAYSRACLSPARVAIDSGRRAMRAMLDLVRVKIIEEARLREVDPGLISFTNVNTWDEYQELSQREQRQCGG
jgi:molybdopterin-guanine dinucleotide biosynthesis protein A